MRSDRGRWYSLLLVPCLAACSGTGTLSDALPGAPDDSVPPGVEGPSDDMPTPEADVDAAVGVTPLAGPPYPVVLAHGFFGFDDLGDAGVLTYFYRVRETLTERGYQVFTPTVDPFNDSETRATELLGKIEDILAETGAAKVNIIGHSQGGLDARAVAHMRPDLVASVTTYATPNTGLALADAFDGAPPLDPVYGAVDALLPYVGGVLWGDEVSEKSSLTNAIKQLSKDGIASFNATYPDQPGVAYFSLTGRSAWDRGGAECFPEDRPAFVRKWDDRIDTLDPLLSGPEVFVAGGIGPGFHSNDGLIRVTEARWGRFLGCIPGDHFDEVGLLGDRAGITNDFDHIEFFSDLIDWLYAAGY